MNEGLNILVVEDSPDDVFLLRQAFKKAGATSGFQTASDGLEATAYLKGEGAYADRSAYPFPDVILLDLNMPRMNGFEFLEWLRQDSECRQLMVHVLTTSCRELDVRRACGLHANSYIIKPTRLDELVAFVAALHQWHRFTRLPRKLVATDQIAHTN